MYNWSKLLTHLRLVNFLIREFTILKSINFDYSSVFKCPVIVMSFLLVGCDFHPTAAPVSVCKRLATVCTDNFPVPLWMWIFYSFTTILIGLQLGFFTWSVTVYGINVFHSHSDVTAPRRAVKNTIYRGNSERNV